jgi:hypothetical protein
MIMLKRSFGTSSAVITYVATSLLSFILVSDKECMLMYVLLFGYYPIIQPSINKIKLKLVRIIVKFLIANISVTVIQLILVYVFMIPFLDSNEGIITIILFALLMNILFVVYDFSLKALYILYERKYEKRIKKYFK